MKFEVISESRVIRARDDYLSGPFPYSSLVYKVTQLIINSLLAARGPVPDRYKAHEIWKSQVYSMNLLEFWKKIVVRTPLLTSVLPLISVSTPALTPVSTPA